MAKVTSKYKVSIPKRLADQLSLAPGDEIEWSIAGDELRISRPAAAALSLVEKPALVAFALMTLVALLALAVDRDVELSLRFLLLTLLSVIPVVAVGRMLTPIVLAFKSAVRILSGSAS